MIRIAGAFLALLLILPVTTTRSADNPLIGTWKLKSYVGEGAATGERYNERGEHPNGYLSYAADGRMYAIITWENHVAPPDVVPTDEERIKLFSTVIAYAGTHTFDAEKVIHHRALATTTHQIDSPPATKEGAERREAHANHVRAAQTSVRSLRHSSATRLRASSEEARSPFGAHAGGTRHRLSPRWLSPRTGFPQDAAHRCFARSPHRP